MDHSESPAAGKKHSLSNPAWPLTIKFSLILLFAALLPTLLVAYLQMHGALAGAAVTERANLAQGAEALARQLNQLIDSHKALASLMAKDDDVEQYLGGSPQQRESQQQLIDERLKLVKHTIPNLASIYLLDQTGTIAASADREVVGQAPLFQRYFAETMRGNTFSSDLLRGMISHEPGVYFSAPVVNADNEVLGATMVKLKGSAIDEILNSSDPDMVAFLIDGDGVVIAHPDESWRHRTLRPLSQERLDIIRASTAHQGQPLTVLPPTGLDKALDMMVPASIDFHKPEGEAWVAGVAPVDHRLWRVFLTEPESRFAAPLETLFHRSLATLAAIGLLVVIMAFLLGKAMARPIRILTSSTRQLEQGNYAQTLTRTDLLTIGQRKDELGAPARTFHAMVEQISKREVILDQEVKSRTSELADKNQQLEDTYFRLDEELRLARDMQQALLPSVLYGDTRFQIHAGMEPAREMGGDFYDCLPLSDGRYGILVADVAGKGVPAAFFMAVSSTVLHEVAHKMQSPAAVLSVANDLLCQRNPMELFVTVFYAIYDPNDQSLNYACAGHPPPLLRHQDSRVEPLYVAKDIALGVIPGVRYQETHRQLAQGDLLLVYSDGISEALSSAEEEYGELRLAQWLSSQDDATPPASATALLSESLQDFVGDAESSDDVTQLFLWVRPAHGPLWRKDWRILPHLSSIAVLSRDVEQALAKDVAYDAQALSMLAFHLNLCIDEMVTNIIVHGLKGDETQTIRVTLLRYPDYMEVRLKDNAPPFDCFDQTNVPDLQMSLEDRPIGGLGIHMVKILMDEYSSQYDGTGNLVILKKNIPTAVL